MGVPKETIEATAISPDRLLAFAPDPERGSILYGIAKERLADTFRQLFDASRSVATISEPGFFGFLDQFRRTPRVSPRLFAMYFDILDAISRNNHVKSFQEGLATVEAEGKLSELGHHLMAEAKIYMSPYLSK
jgi:hypothetical protein